MVRSVTSFFVSSLILYFSILLHSYYIYLFTAFIKLRVVSSALCFKSFNSSCNSIFRSKLKIISLFFSLIYSLSKIVLQFLTFQLLTLQDFQSAGCLNLYLYHHSWKLVSSSLLCCALHHCCDSYGSLFAMRKAKNRPRAIILEMLLLVEI